MAGRMARSRGLIGIGVMAGQRAISSGLGSLGHGRLYGKIVWAEGDKGSWQ